MHLNLTQHVCVMRQEKISLNFPSWSRQLLVVWIQIFVILLQQSTLEWAGRLGERGMWIQRFTQHRNLKKGRVKVIIWW